MLSGVQKRQSTLIKSDLQAYEVLNLTLAFHKRGKKNPLRSDSPTHLNTLGLCSLWRKTLKQKLDFGVPVYHQNYWESHLSIWNSQNRALNKYNRLQQMQSPFVFHGLLTCLNLKSRHVKKRFAGSSPSAPGVLQEPCTTHGPQNEVRESWGMLGRWAGTWGEKTNTGW